MKWLPFLCLILISCTDKQTSKVETTQPRPDIEPVLEIPAAPGSFGSNGQTKLISDQPAGKSEQSNAPRIVFEKVRFNFGEIYHADKVDHQFSFTNEGTRDLEIKGVKVSCGCTTPTYSQLPIAPGEQGFIGVKYNSVGKQGAQKATIRVATNDPENPEVKLYLSGRVLVKPLDEGGK
ncbi:MAG: DUF1573 domain-containing protein [Saprospiraceae bacterium]|nr:DUF1573 domain-containing protein [Saprospiraceae bacterium]